VRGDGHAEADHGDTVPGHEELLQQRPSPSYYAR
jgi:hypothetical protein